VVRELAHSRFDGAVALEAWILSKGSILRMKMIPRDEEEALRHLKRFAIERNWGCCLW
jgi:hypothetical protein